LSKRRCRVELDGEPLDLEPESGILGHQPVRLEDLSLALETGGPEAFGALREVGCDGVEREQCVARACGRGLVVAPHEGAADRDAAGGGEPAELALSHDSVETALASAPRMSAVDVAPGSW
jgi:hypothetical protein